MWISFQTRFDGTTSFLFMPQIVGTIDAIAIVTELPIRKAVTISVI